MLRFAGFALLAAVAVLALGRRTPSAAAEPKTGDAPVKKSDSAAQDLKLTLRSREAVNKAKSGDKPKDKPDQETPPTEFTVVEKQVTWDPAHTAVIVVDMWDDHWCRGAAERVVELAGPMNGLLNDLRQRGVLVIHAPSSTVDFYKDTPQRKRAQAAPYAKPPIVLSEKERWGTKWCYLDKQHEGELPIDDSDMGCDCAEKCKVHEAWTRQIAALEIGEPDAITDNGQEVYNLLRQHKIEHILVMGVHLNMCVLGRPFAIRQLRYLGEDVALVRDMTDTMYNSKMRPMVSHFAGTDLVIEHVEKYWCPTTTSADILGGKPFAFKAAKR